jgi:hypothetical protein
MIKYNPTTGQYYDDRTGQVINLLNSLAPTSPQAATPPPAAATPGASSATRPLGILPADFNAGGNDDGDNGPGGGGGGDAFGGGSGGAPGEQNFAVDEYGNVVTDYYGNPEIAGEVVTNDGFSFGVPDWNAADIIGGIGQVVGGVGNGTLPGLAASIVGAGASKLGKAFGVGQTPVFDQTVSTAPTTPETKSDFYSPDGPGYTPDPEGYIGTLNAARSGALSAGIGDVDAAWGAAGGGNLLGGGLPDGIGFAPSVQNLDFDPAQYSNYNAAGYDQYGFPNAETTPAFNAATFAFDPAQFNNYSAPAWGGQPTNMLAGMANPGSTASQGAVGGGFMGNSDGTVTGPDGTVYDGYEGLRGDAEIPGGWQDNNPNMPGSGGAPTEPDYSPEDLPDDYWDDPDDDGYDGWGGGDYSDSSNETEPDGDYW